jgi:hypothetical protein
MGNAEIRLQRRSALTRSGDERSAQRHAGQNRLHQNSALGVILGKPGRPPRHAISRRALPTTQSETGRHSSRHEVAIFERTPPMIRFVVREAENPT